MTLQPLNAHLSFDREYSSIHLYTDAVDLQQNTVGPATTECLHQKKSVFRSLSLQVHGLKGPAHLLPAPPNEQPFLAHSK